MIEVADTQNYLKNKEIKGPQTNVSRSKSVTVNKKEIIVSERK
jgi:hypothetical protein